MQRINNFGNKVPCFTPTCAVWWRSFLFKKRWVWLACQERERFGSIVNVVASSWALSSLEKAIFHVLKAQKLKIMLDMTWKLIPIPSYNFSFFSLFWYNKNTYFVDNLIRVVFESILHSHLGPDRINSVKEPVEVSHLLDVDLNQLTFLFSAFEIKEQLWCDGF